MDYAKKYKWAGKYWPVIETFLDKNGLKHLVIFKTGYNRKVRRYAIFHPEKPKGILRKKKVTPSVARQSYTGKTNRSVFAAIIAFIKNLFTSPKYA